MKSALVLVRTPFQAFLVSSVIAEEAINTFDLIYFTQHDALEDRHYYAGLAERAEKATYCHAPARRFDILAYLDWFRQSRRWMHNRNYDVTLLASIDNYILNAIASRQRDAELVTFDDGTGNFFRSGFYHVDHANRRGRLYRRAFGARDLDDLKASIARHYTLHPQFENIVPHGRIRPIAEWKGVTRRRTGSVRTFFIGAPFQEVLRPEQIDKLTAYMRGQSVDYYVKHPRETLPLALGAPLLDKGGLIAEGAIIKAAGDHPIHIIGGLSSVQFNMAGQAAHRTMVLVDGTPGQDDMIFLGRAAGCEIVLL